MKRRSFLKYLCSVVPVALVDPMRLIPGESETVSFPAITREQLQGTRSGGEYYKDGKIHQFSDVDIYETPTESLNDVLLAVIDRKGWKRGYVYIKTKD